MGKTTAQFELANLYEANHQPLEARKLYEQMQKADPTGPVGQLAGAESCRRLRPPQRWSAGSAAGSAAVG